MQIHGFNKTTLLDYPGQVASTVFTGACNFRCPFCHNSDLVLDPSSQPAVSEEEIFDHISKRKGIITGVCITGGEPTLQADLPEFIRKLKSFGVKVKLDTNGYRPEVIKNLAKEKLVDFFAMDIKSSLEDYDEAAGVSVDTSKIRESIDFLINGGTPYEFRTTVVRELHDSKTFEKIAALLIGAERYYLQGFVDSDRVMCSGLSSYTREEMESFLPIFSGKISEVYIRGVD